MIATRMMNWSGLSLLAFVALCASAPIKGYEVVTHAAITENAYQISNLGSSPLLLQGLGLDLLVLEPSPTVPISRVDISCSNNGNVDISVTSVNTSGASLSVTACTYPSPGSYQALVNVIGGSGQIIYSTTQSIYVVAPADQELMVRAVYVGMLGRLTAGDITGALNAMTAGVYAKYSAVFTSLSNLPSVVSQLGTVQQATVANDVVEYLIVQNTPTGPSSFFVYLIRGEDGIWRIDGM